MQSGNAKKDKWILEYITKDPTKNPLMGWESSSDTLTELKLTMVDSVGNTLAGGNFNALNNMTAAIANDTVGALFQNIASLNPVPQNTNPINLAVDTTVLNIVPYLAKPTFKVKLRGGVNTSINTKTYVKAKISFNIRAVL